MDAAPGKRPPYLAEEVSQAEPILRTKERKIVFIGGLVAALLSSALMALVHAS